MSGPMSPSTRIRIAADVQRYSTSDDDSGCVMDEYAWVPSGIKPDTIHTYFASLPNDKVPFVNSAGEQWRLRQMKLQLPPQDSDVRYCAQLTEAEAVELQNFEAVRKRECLGRGVICRAPIDAARHYCHQCKQPINVEDLVVSAPERFGDRILWHPRCFVCVECTELLVDLIYFKHNENVFCGRHHAEQVKPRCYGCDELIFGEECTEAEGRVWHMGHFVCGSCECQLGGMKYIAREDLPFCVPCYNSMGQLVCGTCSTEIPSDAPHITQGTNHWHATEECFCCISCGRNLLGRKHVVSSEGIHCDHSRCAPSRCGSIRSSEGRSFRPPQPPPRRSPPPPPIQHQNSTPPENIYETVVLNDRPTSSSDKQWIRSRHRRSSNRRHRRSLSMDGSSGRIHCDSIAKNRATPRRPVVRPNYYSAMPPDHHRPYSFTDDSTSDSETEDDDDLYFSHYLNISRPRSDVRPIARPPPTVPNRTPKTPSRPHKVMTRTAKQKTNSKCAVS